MTKRNAINSDFTAQSDGFSIAGGTTARTLTVSGGDVTMSGGGGYTYTFPGATCTLYGTSSTPITATDVSASNLSATNVYATTVTATTDSATNVKATTITATNVSAANITAGAISGTTALTITIGTDVKIGRETGGALVFDSNSTVGAGNASVMLCGQNNSERIDIRSWNATIGSAVPAVMGKAASATGATPNATQKDQYLLVVAGGGHSGAGWIAGTKGLVGIKAAENWNATNNGAYIAFEVTPSGSTTRAEQVRILDNGSISATTISATTFSGSNVKATTVTGTSVSATNVSATVITATSITGVTNLHSTTVCATTVTGTTISGTNVKVTAVTATNVSATDISATTVTATTVSATNVKATSVTATNITASTISATTYDNLPPGGGYNPVVSWSIPGLLSASTTVSPCPPFVVSFPCTPVSGYFRMVTSAGGTSGVWVDIHHNGTTIFSAAGGRVNCISGTLTASSSLITATSFAAGDYLQAFVDYAGQSSSGSNLYVGLEVSV